MLKVQTETSSLDSKVSAQSGAALNRLFQSALQVASRVRTETAVGRGAASVSSAAVQLAKQIFGSLRGRRVMVLGAGEMAELALQCLMAEGVRAAIVANRTYERAAELARLHGATALHYDACWAELADVDVVITSTAARHPVVLRPSSTRPVARHRLARRAHGGGPRAPRRTRRRRLARLQARIARSSTSAGAYYPDWTRDSPGGFPYGFHRFPFPRRL